MEQRPELEASLRRALRRGAGRDTPGHGPLRVSYFGPSGQGARRQVDEGWRSVRALARATLLEPPPPDCLEDLFQAKVEALAAHFGWLYYHAHISLLDRPGFPDLPLAHAGNRLAGISPQFLVAELKTATGRLRAEQQRWLAVLRAAGVEVCVWRPADWPLIVRRLDLGVIVEPAPGGPGGPSGPRRRRQRTPVPTAKKGAHPGAASVDPRQEPAPSSGTRHTRARTKAHPVPK